MQADAFSECVQAAVLGVPEDRPGVMGELDAKLVRPAGLRADFEQRQAAVAGADVEMEQRLFGALRARLDDRDAADLLVLQEPVSQ
jgi:hypothetical protein